MTEAHVLIPMAGDRPETILWRNSIRKGFWHRHTVKILELTTDRIVIIDDEKHTTTRVPWSKIDNVIVMNQHSTGTGYHYTVGTGHYVRNYAGINTWNGYTVGEVCFIGGGVMKVIFKGLGDPHGVANLAKSQIRR
jgi:hypothetical protein